MNHSSNKTSYEIRESLKNTYEALGMPSISLLFDLDKAENISEVQFQQQVEALLIDIDNYKKSGKKSFKGKYTTISAATLDSYNL